MKEIYRWTKENCRYDLDLGSFQNPDKFRSIAVSFNFQFTDITMLLPIPRDAESPELGLEVGF
jgi:hypothetical protein